MQRVWAVFCLIFLCSVYGAPADSREGDDHGNHGQLKAWFDQLKSKKGLCCSFADGVALEDVDWDIRDDGHYAVRVYGQWVLVPDEAVITEPNLYHKAVVWPYQGSPDDPAIQIRCFLPGAGV